MSAPSPRDIRAARRLIHELLRTCRLSSVEAETLARARASPFAGAAPVRRWRLLLPFFPSLKK